METYGILCKTGSCNVITLNLNRIIQDWAKQPAKSLEENNNILDKTVNMPGLTGFKEYLIDILERVYKYQIAYKTILYEEEEKGMLTASKAGYIAMKDLFSTIGINGINEAAEFIGLKCSYNNDYKDFCRLITGTISEQNKLHSTPLFKFNQEFVPKRSGHIKPLLIDLELLIIGQQGASKEEFCAA
jgi:ribonucleoside-triphosphate reductase